MDNEALIKLNIGTYGLIDTLQWSQVAESKLGGDEVEVEVRYVGLNFRVS
jgi:NADPH:quinone reductase-like Zn-dependent oxidoreductase